MDLPSNVPNPFLNPIGLWQNYLINCIEVNRNFYENTIKRLFHSLFFQHLFPILLRRLMGSLSFRTFYVRITLGILAISVSTFWTGSTMTATISSTTITTTPWCWWSLRMRWSLWRRMLGGRWRPRWRGWLFSSKLMMRVIRIRWVSFTDNVG